ncbi:hypothetical protein BDB00DRAFT_786552 [Zychaea mexicana]|uniref:uncharacterized protein n=1 Tax=Zychaea mexicana TaxID=64656 RepID=UPI0022FE87BA|nr:uncharacterized protein BDB00DRAFT_786552 [Zychaea mexicana]KAI9495214.1 hypothetical protein BDB00DRAFT_786552 [Zychaea mexicana]
MGLAGAKVKQRLSDDPNNLAWSNDQSKFGFKMLMKMGWAPGKGLGVNEDGNKEHVKIRLKENTLGLGADKRTTDNWLGNTDAFSQLLADLNSRTAEAASTEPEKAVDDKNDEETTSKKDKKKKRKRSKEGDDTIEGEKEKKKKKKEKKDKKEKKEKKKSSKKDKKDSSSGGSSDEVEKKAPVVLRNAARAKFLRAKRMATQHDKERLNEILGIKPTTSIA